MTPDTIDFNSLSKKQLVELVIAKYNNCFKLEEENKKLKEEKELLKQYLDKLMFDADVVNVKIHGELGDYVYVRSDKQFKLNVKD